MEILGVSGSLPDGNQQGVDTSCMYPSEEAYNEFGIEAYPVLKAGQHFRKQTSMRKKNGDAIWLDISGVRLSEETGSPRFQCNK